MAQHHKVADELDLQTQHNGAFGVRDPKALAGRTNMETTQRHIDIRPDTLKAAANLA